MTQIATLPFRPPLAAARTSPDPNFHRLLAARYGTLNAGTFLPAVPFDLRVKAAVANGVPIAQAVQDAKLTLQTDELKLRDHGTGWSFLTVTACFRSGQGEVTGVDSSDAEGMRVAAALALLRAVEDDRAWAGLGLQGT